MHPHAGTLFGGPCPMRSRPCHGRLLASAPEHAPAMQNWTLKLFNITLYPPSQPYINGGGGKIERGGQRLSVHVLQPLVQLRRWIRLSAPHLMQCCCKQTFGRFPVNLQVLSTTTFRMRGSGTVDAPQARRVRFNVCVGFLRSHPVFRSTFPGGEARHRCLLNDSSPAQLASSVTAFDGYLYWGSRAPSVRIQRERSASPWR